MCNQGHCLNFQISIQVINNYFLFLEIRKNVCTNIFGVNGVILMLKNTWGVTQSCPLKVNKKTRNLLLKKSEFPLNFMNEKWTQTASGWKTVFELRLKWWPVQPQPTITKSPVGQVRLVMVLITAQVVDI